jgi:superfamily II DNA helicase RecQ
MKWWVYIDGKVFDHPLAPVQLKDLEGFSPETKVCPKGKEDWIPAKEISELQEIFNEDQEVTEEVDSGGLKLPDDFKEKKRKNKKERERIIETILNIVSADDFKYGINKTARVLAGSKAKKLRKHNLLDHEMHGALSEYSRDQLKDIIENLIDCKLLDKQEVGEYAYVLVLADKGQNILEGESPPKIKIPDKSKSTKTEKKPSHEISFEMYQKGMSVEEIAKKRDFVPKTVSNHLLYHIKSGEISARELVDESHYKEINDLLDSGKINFSAKKILSAIKDELPAGIAYEEIKLVLAEFEN